MKLVVGALLVLGVAFLCYAVHIDNRDFTAVWRRYPVKPWAGYAIIEKDIRNATFMNLWERAKRLTVLHLKDIAEDYANKHGATLNQLKGFLYLNLQFYRYHWRTFKKGLMYYMEYFEPYQPQEMKTFMTNFTKKFATALKMDRVYAHAMESMPHVTYRRYFNCKRLLRSVVIPPASVTGNKEGAGDY